MSFNYFVENMNYVSFNYLKTCPQVIFKAPSEIEEREISGSLNWLGLTLSSKAIRTKSIALEH